MPRLLNKRHSVADVETRRFLPWKAHRLLGAVTLEEIVGATKISKRFLEAIESGEYSELPGGVFTTSYIRQYAEQIGYDSGEILRHRGEGVSGAAEGSGDEAVRWMGGMSARGLEKG
jgi:cytoskeletal protein RodZ